MVRTLVPVKVSIGLKANGMHDYPAFNTLPIIQASGMDWAAYVDIEGSGWHYDQCCGHDVDTIESPAGVWHGLLLVPARFASEAVAAFPGQCSILSETVCAAFYNDHAHVQDPDEEFDIDVLQAIRIKTALNQVLTVQQRAALDPTSDTPGIRRNKRRYWAGYKALTGIQVP